MSFMPAAKQTPPLPVPADVVTRGAHQPGAVLRIDIAATPLAIARIASIMAQRQFGVLTMDVAAPVDGLRRITVEVDTVDEIRLGRLVKFLNRSPDVVKVVHLLDEKSHPRSASAAL